MGTSVHIPPPLLASVDKRAKELGLSRNRYIVQALEKALRAETRWSQGFVDEIDAARADHEGQEAMETVRRVVAASRRSKPAPPL